MNQQTDEQILKTLEKIRDGQREMIALLAAQRAATEEQIARSRTTVEASIALQKEALNRQRTLTRIAIPGIVACVAAILYLVLRYF